MEVEPVRDPTFLAALLFCHFSSGGAFDQTLADASRSNNSSFRGLRSFSSPSPYRCLPRSAPRIPIPFPSLQHAALAKPDYVLIEFWHDSHLVRLSCRTYPEDLCLQTRVRSVMSYSDRAISDTAQAHSNLRVSVSRVVIHRLVNQFPKLSSVLFECISDLWALLSIAS